MTPCVYCVGIQALLSTHNAMLCAGIRCYPTCSSDISISRVWMKGWKVYISQCHFCDCRLGEVLQSSIYCVKIKKFTLVNALCGCKVTRF